MKKVQQKHILTNNNSFSSNKILTQNEDKKSISSQKEEKVNLDEQNAKMGFEEIKEDVNIEELMDKEMIGKKKNKVNLDDSKKKLNKKEYDIDDTVLRDITLAGDIHFQLISNINGYFVDIRKYFKSYPTKKGIRMLASKFVAASNLLKDDLSKVISS